jgi:hypothetical protein
MPVGPPAHTLRNELGPLQWHECAHRVADDLALTIAGGLAGVASVRLIRRRSIALVREFPTLRGRREANSRPHDNPKNRPNAGVAAQDEGRVVATSSPERSRDCRSDS